MSQNNDFGWLLDDSHLRLVGRISGQAPVEAEGTVDGKKFYFRARHDKWDFSLVEDSDADPADPWSFELDFYREATYGKRGKSAASYMPYDEAEAFIKQCAQEYLDARNV